ncbi:MAG TPA: DMT family transporter [Usitatibacteraceae bacterium]|nr:DMT family transporter [Usitatibacteraceae bacterium]
MHTASSLGRGPRLAGVALVVFSAVAFSAKAVIIKLAYRHGVDAVTLLALRMAMSAPFFVAIAWWASRGEGAAPLAPADWRAVVFLGIVGYYLASLFDFLGLQYITAALERLVLFLYPTFVVLISAAMYGRRITGRDVAALAVSYAGIALVFANDLATRQENVLLGAFWVSLSALAYAIYLIGNGRMVRKMGSVRFASLASVVSCAAVLAHFFVVRDAGLLWSQPGPVYWLTLLMAIVSTVLPVILMSVGIRLVGSSHASMLGTVGPVATIFLGFAFLGEPITAIQLAGAALVLAGVVAISRAPGKGD